MAAAIFEVDYNIFEAKALIWSKQFEQICFLQSNGYADEYGSIQSLLAVDASYSFENNDGTAFTRLKKFKSEHPQQWMFGFFSYDLKNETENLKTTFPNPLDFPDAYFFIPKLVIKISSSRVEIIGDNPQAVFDVIQKIEIPTNTDQILPFKGKIQSRMSKKEYLHSFDQLKSHIKRGDIYEVNLCQEFYAEYAQIDPLQVYQKLNIISPTPFSTFFKIKDKYIISASPERFLAKRDQILISQPIKGTAPRGSSVEEDEIIKTALRLNPKEIAENVMIVDLVRNDMTRSAEPGTVATERKLEVKSYKQVHQLVSTITCVKNKKISDIESIKNIFPPGSMTGAPKINAMRLCDTYESSRRGVYSGTVGYFSPNGDFDFNVIIRTILYNTTNKYLSFHTGGAITYEADGEKEYQECLLKASAILKTLKTTL